MRGCRYLPLAAWWNTLNALHPPSNVDATADLVQSTNCKASNMGYIYGHPGAMTGTRHASTTINHEEPRMAQLQAYKSQM